MKIETKKGGYFIYLPSKLHNKIVELAKEHDSINLDLLAFLLNLILKGKYKDKNLVNGSKWVKLCSDILKKYDFKEYTASKHLKFLEQHGLVESLTHINNIKGKKNSCKRFRIIDEYLANQEKGVTVCDSTSSFCQFEVRNHGLSRKVQKHINHRKAIAEYKTEHLTKWLTTSGYSIDAQKALEYVDRVYFKKDDESRKTKRYLAICDFKRSINIYSRCGKDDRLHSYFTSLPSDLKQFVKYNGCHLKEVDIKNSQPFIFSFILAMIQQEYYNEINKYSSISLRRFSNRLYKRLNKLINTYNDEEYNLDIRSICDNITIMLQESMKPTDFTEFNTFISLVHSGEIYEHVGKALLSKDSIKFIDNKYKVKLFDKDSCTIQYSEFDTLRKCAKKVTINALYGTPNETGVLVIQDFKLLFPEVAKYLRVMKQNDKAELPILMQQIESKFVLDYCSKKIAKKYPEMLLISRHDSLTTTEKDFHHLKAEFQQLLNNYFKVNVKLGEELWE